MFNRKSLQQTNDAHFVIAQQQIDSLKSTIRANNLIIAHLIRLLGGIAIFDTNDLQRTLEQYNLFLQPIKTSEDDNNDNYRYVARATRK